MIINLVIALAILFGLYHAIRFAGRAPPKVLVRATKMAGGVAACGVALFLFLRGHTEIAVALVGLGAWIAGYGVAPQWLQRFTGGKPNAQRSAMIELEIDPKSGAMQGSVLAGTYEGRQLGELTPAECDALYKEAFVADPAGARLLEIYFDRRFAGWRAAGERDADAGNVDTRRSRSSGTMTEDEAYEVLGLQKSATRDEITAAHRALMKKLHPDHGGTTALAARVNEAKDILMRRHQSDS
jgi:hypothetical protein